MPHTTPPIFLLRRSAFGVRCSAFAFPLALLLCSPALAQQRSPHIGYLYPAGAQSGTTIEFTVGGQFLDGLSSVHLSDPSLSASVVEFIKPITNKQALELRDRLQELLKRRPTTSPSTQPAFTKEDEKELADIRRKLERFVRKPSSPAIAETATLRITIPKNASPGPRELRVRGSLGLSNPLPFVVGALPEFISPAMRPANEPTAAVPRETHDVTLPSTLNGQIGPGGVDRFSFPARKGQTLTFRVDARSLIPYLADAVPGWFQSTLALYDPKGRELSYNDDHLFNPDPTLTVKIPETATYSLEIKDAIYRGREDFVYRITATDLPTPSRVGTAHRLPPSPSPATPGEGPPSQLGTGNWQLGTQLGTRNSELGTSSSTSHTPQATIHPVTLPTTLTGTISHPGETHTFTFDAPANQPLVAEVTARRNGSPLDSTLQLLSPDGKPLASNDDHPNPAQGLETHHADSYLSTTLPTAGRYTLRLSDAQHKSGPNYTYHLRISPPQPDFALRVVPSSINARPGTTIPLTVYALRHDNFTGEITLSLDGVPEGYRLLTTKIPADQDKATIQLSLPRRPSDDITPLLLVGRANLPAGPATRPAVPADDMMQAFLYRHLVPADQLLVTLVGRPLATSPQNYRPTQQRPQTRPTTTISSKKK